MNENNGNLKIKTVHWVIITVTITVGIMIWIFTSLNAKADKSEVKEQGQKIERMALLVERIATKIGVDTR